MYGSSGAQSDITSFCMFAHFRSYCCIAWHDDGSVLQVQMESRGSLSSRRMQVGVYVENTTRSIQARPSSAPTLLAAVSNFHLMFFSPGIIITMSTIGQRLRHHDHPAGIARFQGKGSSAMPDCRLRRTTHEIGEKTPHNGLRLDLGCLVRNCRDRLRFGDGVCHHRFCLF